MNDQLPLAYILVTTYNGKRFLEKCFGTLEKTNYPNRRLLLVDNGSTDDSVEFVRDNFPQVEILSLAENASLAYASNCGFRYAIERGAEFIAILNDDTEAVDSRWLGEAIALAQSDDQVGIVGFLEIYPPRLPDILDKVEAVDVDYLCGFAIGFRSDVLEGVGMFDASYARFALDDDLVERVTKAGFRLKELNIPIFHYCGGTNRKFPWETGYLQMRDSVRFSIKHRGLWRAALRMARYIDVACNPWPFFYQQSGGTCNRIRYCGNSFMRAWACFRAATWNVVHLPQTLKIARREARQIQLAQLQMQRETQCGSDDKLEAPSPSPAPVTCVGSYPSTEIPSL